MNIDCIEAIVSGRRIAVPVRSVERLAELDVRGPVPLAHPWVGGLGRSEADAVVTLALAPPDPAATARATRTTAALVLKERTGGARWAIEVDRVLGFRQLAVGPLPAGRPRLPVPAGMAGRHRRRRARPRRHRGGRVRPRCERAHPPAMSRVTEQATALLIGDDSLTASLREIVADSCAQAGLTPVLVDSTRVR